MRLRDEFCRVISSTLLVWAVKVTPAEDVHTLIAFHQAAKAMIADDRRRGVKLREAQQT
jgi:hypothetical protein